MGHLVSMEISFFKIPSGEVAIKEYYEKINMPFLKIPSGEAAIKEYYMRK